MAPVVLRNLNKIPENFNLNSEHPSAQNLMKSNDAMISFNFVGYGICYAQRFAHSWNKCRMTIHLFSSYVRSCDQKPYLHNETKGGICIKIEFNPQKNISLLQHGRQFFVYSYNMAAVTSCEHTDKPNFSLVGVLSGDRGEGGAGRAAAPPPLISEFIKRVV